MEATKRGRGRPEKPPEDRKTAELRIRLTESERAELDQVAGAMERDTSTWARELLLRAARRKSGAAGS